MRPHLPPPMVALAAFSCYDFYPGAPAKRTLSYPFGHPLGISTDSRRRERVELRNSLAIAQRIRFLGGANLWNCLASGLIFIRSDRAMESLE